jgi:nitrogen-specific signal transduction histidine kinase/CheY-like chemotaxis protein
VLDVTEKKELEHQFLQSQKMEAIGRLAGGVAHDFNNLLTVVSGYSDILLSRLSWNDPDREWIREIHKAGEQAAALTRQLLAFSRKQVLEPRVVNLNEVVADIERMLCRLIGEDVQLATAFAPRLRSVKVDPGQIEQVILNLAVNSRDAMPQGGKLTIETANVSGVQIADRRLQNEKTPGGGESLPGRSLPICHRDYVLLAVSDTGCGMRPEVLEHIFEPFFTTKAAGKGTGLGLATVYGIVQQSTGFIRVYSEPGWGTTFKIYFPAVESSTRSEESAFRVEAPLGGDETILVVEDDAAVRTLIRLALVSHGYTVLVAERGEEAIRLAGSHAGPIHLLVTDVVMPEMGGREAADRLTALRPGLKVLYVSGYTDDAVVRHGVLEAQAHFMQKPFAPSALVAKVRQILGQHATE